LYQYFELNKSIYQSISHRDFLQKKSKRTWLDTIVSEKDILNHPVFIHFPDIIEEQLLKWYKNGYIIWPGFLDSETVDTINDDIDHLLDKKKVAFNYTGRKIFNAYKQSFTTRKIIKDKRLLELFSFILDKKVFPFQTINFLKGSEQQAHSDAIHMCTFPKGNVLAAWMALEDISEEQGPISYYPGSHQLPYLTNDDYPNHNNPVSLDPDANKKYEKKVAVLIEENNLKKQIFTAKKGDLFIWHGNLIHGGEPMINPALSRKSMVVHYFGEGVICYHEISERPAIFDTDLVGEIQDEFYKGDALTDLKFI
jgi:ectoine hydroxylase-related dioxygenase (phytanoyl-CoA dioxygenase family)